MCGGERLGGCFSEWTVVQSSTGELLESRGFDEDLKLAAEAVVIHGVFPMLPELGPTAEPMDCSDGTRDIEGSVLVQREKDRRDDHPALFQPDFAQPLEVDFEDL